MQERFDNVVRGLISPGERVLLAVSGGIDSMVMATLCLRCRESFYFEVVHCNFRLRGEESDADEALVHSWCNGHGIPFIGTSFDTAGLAAKEGISIEMEARNLRYSLFEALCSQHGFSGVFLAHNANDNAETLVLNLLRGTGIAGLCGMGLSSRLPLKDASGIAYRPMLSFTRKEIEEFASAEGVKFREDRTNSDISIKRNRIRHEVFPEFREINPSFLETFSREMNYFAQVRDVADSWYKEKAGLFVERVGDNTVIDLDKIVGCGNAPYLVYRVLLDHGFRSFGDILELIGKRAGGENVSGRVFTSGNARITFTNYSIIISPLSGVSADDTRLFEGPGRYSFDGISLDVRAEGWARGSDPRQADGTAILDRERLPQGLVFRRWQDGDFIRLLGLGGRKKKLSDLFTDLKFSLIQKQGAVVFAAGNEVFAVFGKSMDGGAVVRVSEVSKVSSSTNNIFRISIL